MNTNMTGFRLFSKIFASLFFGQSSLSIRRINYRVSVTFSSGHYYKMAGEEELEQFLSEPEKYVPPLAPRQLPKPSMLPRRRTSAEAKQMFPKAIELKGYCPVTFLDGKCR